MINPLGFSLERYDAVGKYRTREKNRVIDALSEYVTDEGDKVSLSGPRDIAEFAISSEPAQNAFIEQLFHQVVKQPILAYGEDMIDRLRQSFVASRFDMQRLLVDITTVAALYHLEYPMVGRKTK